VITVRLPGTLQVGGTDTLVFSQPLATIADLVTALDRRVPGFRDQLDDSIFNFAVNDVLLLQHVQSHALTDGDRVEIIATISGGSGNRVIGQSGIGPATARPLKRGR
jgi:molybdopterin converting factor small subunit